jgi:hypothetical protein
MGQGAQVKSYTVTISPDDGAGATAVMQVAVSSSGSLLKRFSLVASEGDRLSAEELLQFDSRRLVAAVLSAMAHMPGGEEADEPATPIEAVAATRPRADISRHSAKALAPTARRSAKQVPVTAVSKSEQNARRQRNYRVMPADFLTRYGQNTMAELAELYEVPLYTIQSWISTARKQGKLPAARKRRARMTHQSAA